MAKSSESRLSQELWDAQVAFMHFVIPRKKALQIKHLQYEIIFNGYKVPMALYSSLQEELKQQGIKFQGGLCQLSKDSLVMNHGRTLEFDDDPPKAVRGALLDFTDNERRYFTMILDPGRSRLFYDQMNKGQKASFTDSICNQIWEFPDIPPSAYFALLTDIRNGYRIEEFAKV
jgi:hypothetical protein